MSRSPFPSVRTASGLLPTQLLEGLTEGKDLPGIDASSYHLAAGESVRQAASRAWEYLAGAWSAFRAELARRSGPTTRLTRERWLLILLRELQFGRVPVTPAGGLVAAEKAFPVSHVWEHVPVHLLGWGVDLDRRTPGMAGAAGAAPQAMVQELLNQSDDHLWALLSNGQRLRLLRDSTSLVGSAYVEVDLEAMFDGGLFSDFVLLFQLCHQSRFEPLEAGAGPAACWLERWRTVAAEQGMRALDQLRGGVQDAIAALGTGFLQYPSNAVLRERLASGALRLEDFQRALLRCVYRLLFWFVAEDREALHPRDADDLAVRRYAAYFSSDRLREQARLRRGDRYADLWQAVSLAFGALGREGGRPELGLPGIGGLFDHGPLDAPIAGGAGGGGYPAAELANQALLSAVRSLSIVRDKAGGPRRRVDFLHLGAEELGSVYESLLELHPRHDPALNMFWLEAVAGSERKTTGSYYTPSSLVECLLDTALDPLLDEACRAEDPVGALLALTVCDPACGSGHFLVAAARRIAKRVAAIETDEPEPTPDAVRSALPRVVSRCIYGVDINPMAAELAKVSLWLEALDPGQPLSFLDANIRIGNALLGVTPALLAAGIPDEAFAALEGDDKKITASLRKRNKAERGGQDELFASSSIPLDNVKLGREVSAVIGAPSTSLADVHVQATRLAELEGSPERRRARLIADAWCAAFFQHKTTDTGGYAITQAVLEQFAAGHFEHSTVHRHVEDLARDYRFFHWHLEFPHILVVVDAGTKRADPRTGWIGGFSLVLGNPPWDTLSPDAKEFFSAYDLSVRFMKKSEQQVAITNLLDRSEIEQRWVRHRRHLFATVLFIKKSGRYRLFAQGNLGKGDFNVYRMFVETALTLTALDGMATQVTPSGLYNGANAAAIRGELFDRWSLLCVLGLINKGEAWFNGIDATTRFACYVARRGGLTAEFAVGFQISSPIQLTMALERPHRLAVTTVRDQSPEALVISEMVDDIDANITDHLYRLWPAFGDDTLGVPARHYMAEIHMGNDRDRFGDDDPGLPLYEGRMIAQYDHRAKAYISGRGRSAIWRDLPFESPEKGIKPQWWVPINKIPTKAVARTKRYRIAFCDVTAPRNERSLIAALVPPGVICGHTAPTFTYEDSSEWAYTLWLAVANSLPANFLIRKRITLHVSLNILDSLPMPRLQLGDEVLSYIASLVLRLTCTGPEMTAYWNAMAVHGWCQSVPDHTVPANALLDDDARAEARAKIDVVVAKYLYRLTKQQVEHILTTFPTLERNEIRRHGEYRTKRLILEIYDTMADWVGMGKPYPTPLDPPPDPRQTLP